MDKLKLMGPDLGRVFNSRCENAGLLHTITQITKTAQLKVENLAKTTFRLSPFRYQAPRYNRLSMDKLKLTGLNPRLSFQLYM
jgi:hypothetical protein